MLREAGAPDLDDVARVQALSWKAAYRGLVPDWYLEAIDPVVWAARLRERIADGRTTLLACEREDPLGMISFGTDRGHELDVEIYALYVLPTHGGRGIGRQLVDEALRSIPSGAVVGLWCAQGNGRARRFYERYGFMASGAESTYDVAETALPTVQYCLTVTPDSYSADWPS